MPKLWSHQSCVPSGEKWSQSVLAAKLTGKMRSSYIREAWYGQWEGSERKRQVALKGFSHSIRLFADGHTYNISTRSQSLQTNVTMKIDTHCLYAACLLLISTQNTLHCFPCPYKSTPLIPTNLLFTYMMYQPLHSHTPFSQEPPTVCLGLP